MKTEQDLRDLIINWESDPCWNIEETEGFEEYKESLKSFRLEKEAEWKAERETTIKEKRKKYGCNEEMLKLIETLQHRIEILESREQWNIHL